ncbi:hypothetical protein [Kitasatospora terrestris]
MTSVPSEANKSHVPGSWPRGCKRTPVGDEAWMRYEAERASREVFLGVVRADLEQQPSPRAVRAAGRRWCTAIVALADDVAKQKQEGGR